MRISDWSSDVCSSDLHRAHCGRGAVLAQQVEGELLGLHGEALVFLRDRVQVVQALGEFAVLVAQHFQLVAGQRRGRAFLARHHHADRQVRELLQELRMQPQPGGDFVGTEFFGGFAHCNHSPSNTNAVGPDIKICAPSPGQAMRSSPPGSATATSRSTRRSEEHTSELQSLMRLSYAVFCLKKKKNNTNETHTLQHTTHTR